MGVVLNFPRTERTGSLKQHYDEPAQVITLPLLRIERSERTVKSNLPVPIMGPPCKS